MRQVVLCYGQEFSVASDPTRRVWYEWGVEAWPKSILVDPAGNWDDFLWLPK